jgi:class 3 adenylate cyclase
MAAAFGYVAYSAFVRYRREGAATGLFDAVGGEHTLRRVRQEYGAALEALVAALRHREEGQLSAEEMALITARLARRFGLTEGQTAVLSRAAGALAREREQTRRLDALVAVGHQSRVLTDERELVRGAVRRIAAGFDPHVVRVGLLEQGRLVFPAEFATDPYTPVDAALERAAGMAVTSGQPIRAEPGTLVLPLMVKELPAGVLAVQGTGAAVDRQDAALFTSLASQLSIGLENVRLYGQLHLLFRQYMSPDVAAALIADPSQAALGGAVFDVTVLFADLSGFTPFSERSSPPEVVAMLNRYFEVATTAILAESGTIVQYIGDALMALFNAPARQPDHASRAARAGLAMQHGVDTVAAQIPGWPRFRVGINTGEALVGNIGSEVLRNYNATGDAVNVAARLESLAKPGQVVIGGATYAALDGWAQTTPLGDVVVKGRRQPVTAYLLHDLRVS